MSKLQELLAGILEVDSDTIGEDVPFTSLPGWDSLKHIELIVGIETGMGVNLTAEEIGRMTSSRAARAVLAAKGCDA